MNTEEYILELQKCSVCKSSEETKFVEIAKCRLCKKCDQELSDRIELAFFSEDEGIEL